MKFLSSILILVLSVLFISSCQKELSFDTDGISTGSLKSDSTFECLPSTVNGVYKVDSILGDENYMDLQVDVVTTGAYIIETDTVNGYSFKGVGTFGAAGINAVRLYGTGKPVLQGINTFIVKYDSSFCFVDVEVFAGTVTNADYTFGGAGGTCTGAPVFTGTYMEGLAMSASNTVTLDVTVISIGAYDISTTTVNGVTFEGTGNFTSTTAPQTVQLTATGTPLVQGPFTFPVSGNGSSCSFSVTFDAPAPPAVFTLGGNPGSCTGVSLGGTYQQGGAMGASNTATVSVTVTTPGTYTLNATANGVTFSASGLFTTATTQNVQLTAIGTATAAGAFDFIVNGATGTCTFPVTFTAAATDFIQCKIDGGALTTFNVGADATYESAPLPTLSVRGASTASQDPSIDLGIVDGSGTAITTNSYGVNQLIDGILLSASYFDAAGTEFFAGTDAGNQTQTPGFTIVITNITATRVIGTFSGRLKENGGAGPAFKDITEGAFDLPLP